MKDSIRRQAQELTDVVIEEFKAGHMEMAWNAWCQLYDLFPLDPGNKEYTFHQLNDLDSFLSQIDDDTVFAVTDYGRNQYYAGMDYC